MKKIITKSIILFFLTFSSCFKVNIPLDAREDYLGDQLRIDGLYHQITPDGYIVNLRFFYRNGIQFIISFSEKITDPAELDSILTKEKIESHRKRKYNWGIFKINNNDFFSEHWATPENGNYLAKITMTGEILSDTCYMTTELVHSQ